MSDTGESRRRPQISRQRRWVILGVAGLILAGAVAVLALFQPWKLWVDDEVDEAAPVGAVPITAPVDPTDPSTSTRPSTAAPPTTVVPATSAVPTATLPATPSPTTDSPTTDSPTTDSPTTDSPIAVASIPVGGELVSLDHDTSGTVVLLQDASGTQFVRLEDLDTSNGPDLFVYLSTNPLDGPESQFDDDFVNLGRLEGNVGSSNYAIPTGTDLFRYASVVIWCDRFDSAFGAAPLS